MSSAPEKLTPMMQQYFEVKRSLPRDTILLFRLGDFYEMFHDDAAVASKLCGLTLTKRGETPMAGIPHHAADNYITKLLAAGKKIAICDQAEPAKAGKLVRRAVTRILSPGTTLAANQLDAQRNHYLCALTLDKAGLHAAWLDLSTGEFRVATDARPENLLPVLTALDPAELIVIEGDLERWKTAPHDQTAVHALHAFCEPRLCTDLPGYHFETAEGLRTVTTTLGVLNLQGFGLAHDHPALGPAGALVHYATENLLPVLTALDPAELIVIEGDLERWKTAPHDQTAIHALHAFCEPRLCTDLPGYHFETAEGLRTVTTTLGVLNLQGFGLAHDHPALGPAGALVHYATENLCAKPENLRSLQEYRSARTLLLDPATLRNLEIFQSSRGTRDGSLLSAINRTGTAAGARLLERWLAAPTLDLAEIQRRSALVGELLADPLHLGELREWLDNVRDIPRILGRLQNRLRNPRELGGIRDTLAQLPMIRTTLASFGSSSQLSALGSQLQELPSLLQLLTSALADELPADLADGNYIRAGHCPELDRLRSLTTDNKTWLSDLERGEQERTGIRSLKIKFTNNFGYYIEITKANLHLVPPDYIRRQTTVNGERYVTEDLRTKEKEIFHAEENALAREQALFAALVAAVLDESIALARTADTLAELDVLAGWSVLAREWDYCQPVLDEGDTLEIIEGRHPVVEQMLKDPAVAAGRGTTSFVPNDTLLSSTDAQLALITGPNMAGKSTYIRQVALITLLAQVGCWTPAKTCRVGLVDRIFSRVGASDDLARGNSTFMVEMNETANILNNATDRSLIILDEIGRGTSTYDGLSIAWAVVEHLHRDAERGPRTLFATHYQELTQLEKHLARLRNFSVAVKEWNDEIVFVRRVIPGAADRSYGIQVARLAGLPITVIDRAKVILQKLESDDTSVELPSAATPKARPKKKITVTPEDNAQLNLL